MNKERIKLEGQIDMVLESDEGAIPMDLVIVVMERTLEEMYYAGLILEACDMEGPLNLPAEVRKAYELYKSRKSNNWPVVMDFSKKGREKK